MMPTSVQELIVRMEKLERQNKLLRHGGALLTLAGAAILSLAFASQATSKNNQPQEGSSLVLKDADGNQRGWLVVRKEGIGLAFSDAGGISTGLILDANGASLKSYDRNGTPLSGVSAQATGVSIAAKGAGQKPSIGVDALIYDMGISIVPDPIFDLLGRKPAKP